MAKIYSFDLFDTLVERNVNDPKDVFSLVEATGVVKYRFILFHLLSFKFLRVLSEKIARFINKRKKEDINIFEIYKILSFFFVNSIDVLEKEVEVELLVLKPLVKNIEVLKALKKRGCFVCVTSDMYLTLNILKKILHKNNITVDRIYVSSKCELTKASGNLFKYIAKDNDISLTDIVHYGDNLWSDVESPTRLGIRAIHTGVPYHRKSFGFLDSFKSPIQSDPLYKIGYEFCGPLAFAFANFISTSINNKNANVVFGARDSYLFKFAFDLFFNQKKTQNTYYTKISRKLVYMPEVYYTKSLDRLFEGTLNCESFFERIHLECPVSLANKKVWDNKQEIINYLMASKAFLDSLILEGRNVKEYLRSSGFYDEVVFIDLGWRGSIQNSLQTIFKDEIKIQGLYLGTINSDVGKSGFFFENKKPHMSYFHVMQAIAMFEFLFTEPERSLNTIRYVDGVLDFVYTKDEDDLQIDQRKLIQKGAEQFLTDFFSLDEKLHFNRSVIEKSVRKLIKYNTMVVRKEVVELFSELTHSAGFNGSLTSKMIEFEGFSIMSYLKAPWKAYFMAELKKESKIKYYLFMLFFHNVFFFVFYENFKAVFRSIRALIK
jgi:predicted HAD superfamily hydrolase